MLLSDHSCFLTLAHVLPHWLSLLIHSSNEVMLHCSSEQQLMLLNYNFKDNGGAIPYHSYMCVCQ